MGHLAPQAVRRPARQPRNAFLRIQPFPGSPVGRLGVHVNPDAALIYPNQVIFCLTSGGRGIRMVFKDYLYAGN